MMEEPKTKETATSGSEPENKEINNGAAPAETDVELDENGKPLPFNEHPKWKSARLAEKKLQEIFKSNDLENLDDLIELVESGKAIKGKIGDVELLDEIIEKALTLEKYEVYWKEQEELKKKNDETPEQTIRRLEQEIEKRDKTLKQVEEGSKEIKEAREAIKFYESEVSDLVKGIETISKEQRPFLLEFFGVDNLSNEIDITDRKAIKSLVSNGTKKFEALKQQIIKDYVAGKEAMPRMSSATVGGEPGKPKIMMKDARKALRESLMNSFKG